MAQSSLCTTTKSSLRDGNSAQTTDRQTSILTSLLLRSKSIVSEEENPYQQKMNSPIFQDKFSEKFLNAREVERLFRDLFVIGHKVIQEAKAYPVKMRPFLKFWARFDSGTIGIRGDLEGKLSARSVPMITTLNLIFNFSDITPLTIKGEVFVDEGGFTEWVKKGSRKINYE